MHLSKPHLDRLLTLALRAGTTNHLGWAARLCERACIERRIASHEIWMAERGPMTRWMMGESENV